MAAKEKSSVSLTNRQILAKVKHWQVFMGLTHLKVFIEIFEDSESDVAGTASPNPQYRLGYLRFNTMSPDFKRDPDAVIRHELAHLLLGMYVKAVENAVSEPSVLRILADLEDEAVTMIERMPALAN